MSNPNTQDLTSFVEYVVKGVSYQIKNTNKEQNDIIETTLYQPTTLQLLDKQTFVVTDEEGLEHGYIVAFEGEGYQYISKYPDEQIPKELANEIEKLNIHYKIDVSHKKLKGQIRATFQEEFDAIYT